MDDYKPLIRGVGQRLYSRFLGNTNSADLHHYLIRGGVGGFVVKVVGMLLSFVTSVVLARVLGAKGFGVFVYVMSIITLLAVPTNGGLPNLLVRYIAAYQTTQRWGLMRGLLARSVLVVLSLSVVIAAAAAFVGWLVAPTASPLHLLTFHLGLVLLPFLALGALRGAALRGLHRVVLGQVPDVIVKPVLILALLNVTYMMSAGGTLNPATAMGIYLISGIVGFALGTYWLIGAIPIEVKRAESTYEMSTWFKASAPLMLLGGFQVINQQADVVMLGTLLGAKEAGIYRAAARGAELVPFVLGIANTVLAPAISRMYVLGQSELMQRTVKVTTRIALLCSVLIAAPLMLGGAAILGFFFGPEFSAGGRALGILCVAQLVNVALGSVALLLMMTGRERITTQGVGIAAFLNVLLNAVLIPPFGIEGAAVATGISLVVWNIILALAVKKTLHMSSTAW